MYTNIIFVHDCNETYVEVEQVFEQEGFNAAIDFLAQWDYGYESEYDLIESVPRCPLENHYTRNENDVEYILIEHPLYFVLYRKAYGEE